MEKIRIESKLSLKEYIRLMYRLTYRKPMVIIISLIGFFMLILSALYFLGLYRSTDQPPYSQLAAGLFVSLVLPFSVYRAAKRQFNSNERLKELIVYEFNPEHIQITGESFRSELTWSKTHKIIEISDWIIIYQSKLVANVIPRRCFEPHQLDIFRNLVKSTNVRFRLKK